MMGVTIWQIQGTASVTGLPAMPASTVNYKVQFQQLVGGKGGWINLFSVSGTTTSNNGTAQINTGFLPLDPGPNQGDQYRIVMTGSYVYPGPPKQNGNFNALASPAVTPIPNPPPCCPCASFDVPRQSHVSYLLVIQVSALDRIRDGEALPRHNFRSVFNGFRGAPNRQE